MSPSEQAVRRIQAAMKPLLWAKAMALSVFAAAPPVHAAVTLVKDGKAQASIVVAKAAIAAEVDVKPDDVSAPIPLASRIAAAARDLQRYVEKISGAKLPIISDEKDPGGALVLVGKSALTGPFDGKIPAGLTPARAEGGLLILCQGNRLVLAGNDEEIYHGTEYAVAELLHRLGVRWFMPGDYGDWTPKMPTIEIADMEVRQKPDFKMRNWWGPSPKENWLAEYRWKIRNKMNPVLHFVTIPGDSSARNLLPKELLKTEPALFGQKLDGQPDEGMPNLSNPKTVARAAQTIKEHFKKNPKQNSYGFAPDDGLPRDWTPETVKRNL